MPKASTIIVTVVAVAIIWGLSGAIYYFSVHQPEVAQQPQPPLPQKPKPAPTVVTAFSVPETLPKMQKSGNCFAGSIAYPYRQDAFRCMAQNQIYDPCFLAKQKNTVFCPINPLQENAVAIKLNRALPKPSTIEEQDNWAWFLVLQDGTYCSPFTGTRPILGQDKAGYYACSSPGKSKQIMILGDLAKDDTWKANVAVLSQSSKTWNIDSEKQESVSQVWQ